MRASWSNSAASLENGPCSLWLSQLLPGHTGHHLYLNPAALHTPKPFCIPQQPEWGSSSTFHCLPDFRFEMDWFITSSIILKNKRQEKIFYLKSASQYYPGNLGATLTHHRPVRLSRMLSKLLAHPQPHPVWGLNICNIRNELCRNKQFWKLCVRK